MMMRVRCNNRKGKGQIELYLKHTIPQIKATPLPINNNTQKRYLKQGSTHISLRIEGFVDNES
jgi:hypothetical protein